MSEIDRQAHKEKTGVDTGARAINPVTKKEIPIWISDYVIYGYGTGAIMAVPGHDERDWEFAKTFGLPIVEVISGGEPQEKAHSGEGKMVNSGDFDGTPTADGNAVRKVTEWLEKRGLGKRTVQYKLRDWTFARQRYWGEPIPIVKRADGSVKRALTVEELPLVLPEVDDYAPTGTGESPLSRAKDWVSVREGGETLQRETQTMPGSAGSSWYFLRYCDPHNERELCAREKSDYWMPVDLYVGGPEHTVGHLMYARMWQQFLCEMGLVRDPEPFSKLRHQGMIEAFTYYDNKRVVPWSDVEARGDKFFKKGTDVELERKIEKMSKRKKNVVNPDEVIKEHGADAMRVYLCFLGPLDQNKPWAPQGIKAQRDFLSRFWRLFFEEQEDGSDRPRVTDAEPTEEELKVLHKAIKKVSTDIEKLALNTAVSALHVASNELRRLGTTSRRVLAPLCQLIQPFAPHLAEEIWRKGIGEEGGISYVPWPSWDDRYAEDDLIAIGVQIMGKTRGEIRIAPDADEATAVAAAKASDAARHLEGKTITKVIYKAGKILNLIVK
jgi:leucyl-tRNA synthetase